MQQNQPFKKRIIEQPVLVPHQMAYVKSSVQQHLHQENRPQQQQYYQYESISESRPPQQQQQQQYQEQYQQQPAQQLQQQQPLHHHNQQQFVQYHQPILRQHLLQHQHYQQQQYDQPQQHFQPIQPPQQQMINHDNVEKPMTLNAWTQTRNEDFASSSNKNEIALLAKIRELEQSLRAQTDFIIQLKKDGFRTPSPPQDVPNSTTITPTSVKNDGTRYRILAQADEEVSSGSQIEIEFNDDSISHNLNYSADSDRLEICLSDDGEMSPRTPEGRIKLQHSHPARPDLENATVSIGPRGTKIPVSAYEQMNWSSCSLATRKLLSLIFDRRTLATHSMTGKASPAFKDLDKPIKDKLDPDAVQDIIFIVSKKCGVSQKEVRSAITTKCADENKLSKLQALKIIDYPDAKRPILRDLNGIKSEDY